MEELELQTATREILGKKVRFLRRQGVIPVHLFGHGIESVALQCDVAQLQQVMAEAGKTKIISLKLDKAKKPRNVMVREIQRNPLTGELLHVDFYQVRMEEKIQVAVPIVLVGEAPALKSKENRLLHELNSLDIECLPDKVPANIEVDISSLTEAGQSIRVKAWPMSLCTWSLTRATSTSRARQVVVLSLEAPVAPTRPPSRPGKHRV